MAMDLAADAERLVGARPHAILDWAVKRFGSRLALACSFGGPTGLAALDMLWRAGARLTVYYLDTELLFPETYATVERIRARYGIDPIAVKPAITLDQQAERFGEDLWRSDPDRCCTLRKVEPQRDFLAGFDAWITGIRRDQSPTRARATVLEWDEQFSLVKINPFASWDERMVWAYVHAYDVPYNAMHDRGYPSIGCVPCTRAPLDGQDTRAGRWPGLAKVECGLHRPHHETNA